jgi:hypothetical protein
VGNGEKGNGFSFISAILPLLLSLSLSLQFPLFRHCCGFEYCQITWKKRDCLAKWPGLEKKKRK